MKAIRSILPGLIAMLATVAAHAAAQQSPTPAAAQRTQAIMASFSKSKHVVKEKRGLRVEKYKDVSSTPAIRINPQEYAGRYQVEDMGFALDLQVDSRGNVSGTGYERVGGDNGVRRTYRLVNGKIDGALLTATQVYADGTREKFEGAFMNRTSKDSPDDKGTTQFGLGVMGRTVQIDGLTIEKFFYRKTN